MDTLQILPSPKRKKPYKELTLREKVELIQLAEENSSLSQANIAERYSIAKSNVCRILQRKAEYLQAHKSAKFDGSRKRKLREDSQYYQEGNETLRAHMLKQHQISRMFMCRCCNWAFPDKTSLHMHMQLQGKQLGDSSSDKESASKVPVIGKSNSSPSSTSIQNTTDSSVFPQNSLFGSQNLSQQMNGQAKFPPRLFGSPNLFGGGVHPMSAALLAAAASNGSGQGGGLFPPTLHADALLTLQQQLNQASTLDQQKPSGLFPQLSMMRNDNVDLLSKLRQRLFFTNMWANNQKVPQFSAENLIKLPHSNEKLLAEFLENNNQLNRVESIGKNEEVANQSEAQAPSTNAQSDSTKSSSKNLAQLMQMLHKNALQNSNLNNNNNESDNKQTADSNNNNAEEKHEEESDGDRLNFIQSPVNDISSDGESAVNLNEKNAHLKMMEVRCQLLDYMNSHELDGSHLEFLQNLLKLTYVE